MPKNSTFGSGVQVSIESLSMLFAEPLLRWRPDHGGFAVQRLLGDTGLKVAATYVQDLLQQTDRVINETGKFTIQDGS